MPALTPDAWERTLLSPNRREIAAKVIDGEAILMNLNDGAYYSMDGVGALVWTLIEAGQPLGRMVEIIAETYGVARSQVRADVAALVVRLEAEKLCMPAAVNDAHTAPARAAAPPKAPYAAPRLNAYHDLQDLLALDPPTPEITDLPWKPGEGSRPDAPVK